MNSFKHEKAPVYIKKLPWKFNVKRLQDELRQIKPLMAEIPWDRNTAPWFPDAQAMSFLHSKECPKEKRLSEAIYSWTPRRMKYNNKIVRMLKYNFKNQTIFNGTLISERLRESRSIVHEDVGVFNEDYKYTEFYNIFVKFSTHYIVDKFRIINLPAFSSVNWHTDNYENLHVPIETNVGCRFVIDDLSYHLPADGSSYQSENCFFHSIFNAGPTDRYNILVSVTGYKDGGYKMCQHYDVAGIQSNHSDLNYIAKPILDISENELWQTKPVHT